MKHRILAIDTSTKTQALALVEEERVMARRQTVVRTNHATSLLRNIDDMLKSIGWSGSDLTLIAVGLGPGTFTGLRVGLANAKAIARSVGAAIVGVDSMSAMARPIAALFNGTVVPITDARRGEVYLSRYRTAEGAVTLEAAPEAMVPSRARTVIEAVSGPVVLVGSGLRAFADLQQWDRANVKVLASAWDAPSSVSIAVMARTLLEERGGDDLAALEPNYVRLSDAELNFGPPDSDTAVLK